MQIGVDSQRAVESKRVFVVDADDISSTVLQCMLADACETHVLPDLASALSKGRDWPPQLLLLGATNLATEGAAAVERLRAVHPALKVMLVCDSPDEIGTADAQALGPHARLLRPLTVETVRRKVDAQLGRRAELGIPVAACGR